MVKIYLSASKSCTNKAEADADAKCGSCRWKPAASSPQFANDDEAQPKQQRQQQQCHRP